MDKKPNFIGIEKLEIRYTQCTVYRSRGGIATLTWRAHQNNKEKF